MSGCGKGDYDTYGSMHRNHDLMETARVTNQSNAIASIASSDISNNSDPTVRALLAVIAMDKIADIKPIPMQAQAPTTGMDVLNSLTSHVPMMVLGGTAAYLGNQMAKSAGTHISENGSMNNSQNPTSMWSNRRDDIITTTTMSGDAVPPPGFEF
jgi:hypothetical protein